MKGLIYQFASDRLHNVQMGIDAFLWRQPETESDLARGPGAEFRAYAAGDQERRRLVLRWGFVPSWLGSASLAGLGHSPWPWVAAERAPASRVFAHALRYQRCLVPADALCVGPGQGAWLRAAGPRTLFLGAVWDGETFALLTAPAPAALLPLVGSRMPFAIRPEDYPCWLSTQVTSAAAVAEMVAVRRSDWERAAPQAVNPAAFTHPSGEGA